MFRIAVTVAALTASAGMLRAQDIKEIKRPADLNLGIKYLPWCPPTDTPSGCEADHPSIDVRPGMRLRFLHSSLGSSVHPPPSAADGPDLAQVARQLRTAAEQSRQVGGSLSQKEDGKNLAAALASLADALEPLGDRVAQMSAQAEERLAERTTPGLSAFDWEVPGPRPNDARNPFLSPADYLVLAHVLGAGSRDLLTDGATGAVSMQKLIDDTRRATSANPKDFAATLDQSVWDAFISKLRVSRVSVSAPCEQANEAPKDEEALASRMREIIGGRNRCAPSPSGIDVRWALLVGSGNEASAVTGTSRELADTPALRRVVADTLGNGFLGTQYLEARQYVDLAIPIRFLRKKLSVKVFVPAFWSVADFEEAYEVDVEEIQRDTELVRIAKDPKCSQREVGLRTRVPRTKIHFEKGGLWKLVHCGINVPDGESKREILLASGDVIVDFDEK